VNIALAGSLRPTSEFALLRDENIVSANDDALVLRLPRTKAQPAGRLVHLHPRDDALCPVAALARFLVMCDAAGWNRGGFLLPAVYKRRYQPLGEPRGGAAIRHPFRAVTDHLGITDDLDTGLRATPHGLRAMSPTKAFAAGMDVHTVMQLTGHTTIKAVQTYDRAIGAPDGFVSAVAADLTSEDPA
jgi:integrase